VGGSLFVEQRVAIVVDQADPSAAAWTTGDRLPSEVTVCAGLLAVGAVVSGTLVVGVGCR
jgi:hypothetical protein